MRKLPRKIIAHFSLELWNNEKGSQIIKKSECGLPNDHFGRLTSVTLVLIIKNKLGSAQVPKFGRLLIKIDSSASYIPLLISYISRYLYLISLISRYFRNCVASCTDCNSNCASWEGKIFSLRGFK